MKISTIKTISLSAIILATCSAVSLAGQNDNLDTLTSSSLNYEKVLQDIETNNLSESEKSALTQLLQQSIEKNNYPSHDHVAGGWTFTVD